MVLSQGLICTIWDSLISKVAFIYREGCPYVRGDLYERFHCTFGNDTCMENTCSKSHRRPLSEFFLLQACSAQCLDVLSYSDLNSVHGTLILAASMLKFSDKSWLACDHVSILLLVM